MSKYSGIDHSAAVELLSAFVRVPSINPAFRAEQDDPSLFGEAAAADVLQSWCTENGIESSLDSVEPGRPNLIAQVKGTTGAKRMLWEGHLDTVQVTGMAEPFGARLEGDRLYGRGAVDDGASIVAFMLALRALKAEPPRADVDFLAAADEEFAYRGVMHHLARGERYDVGVAGEPTSLRVVRACKGTVRWWVEIEGRNAHTGSPEEGINAVTVARKVLDAYDAEMERRTEDHPLLGKPTLTCTAFEAGIGPNTVPGTSRIRFDYRYLPTETGQAVYLHFKSLAEGVRELFPDARIVVGAPFVDSSAMDVPAASEIVQRLGRICAQHGLPEAAVGVPYGSDATKLVNIANIPSVIFGPGSIEQAHTVDEFAEITPIIQAAKMLVDLAHDLDAPH
ncbi:MULTISPECIES: M20/M25/M40 family metallo-hydrolase [unclassified Devosia]|uniref:M20/M25/M40 family metallo-hydrolase n=1 Tax=unclassified Devosia TaxID=196773 RepID=UPI0015567B9B